jgi:hypothetical protein
MTENREIKKKQTSETSARGLPTSTASARKPILIKADMRVHVLSV